MTVETEVQDASEDRDFIVPDLDIAANAPTATLKDVETRVVEDQPDDKAKDLAKPDDDKAKDTAKADGGAGKKDGEAHTAYLLRQARREAREAREVAVEIREELTAIKAGTAAPKQEGPPKAPNPRDFDYGIDDDKYIAAYGDYLAQRDAYVLEQAEARALKKYEELESKYDTEQRVATLQQKVSEIQKKGLDKYKDFDEVVEDAFEAMRPDIGALQSLALQDGAEDVVYHLAKNPAVLERITGMDPMAQAFEMGRLASQFAARRDAAQKSVTKATATPTPPRGSNGQFSSSEDALYDRLLKG